MRILFCFAIIFVVVFSLLPQTDAQKNDAEMKRLHSLFDAEWNYQLEQSPENASFLGDRRWNDKWTDLSIAAIEQRQKHRIEVLEKLAKINRAKLSTADQLNYDLFKKEYETAVEEFRYKTYLLPVSHQNGIQTTDQLWELLRFQTVKDYEDWIARLNAFPILMAQTTVLMQEGIKARIVHPKIIMQRVPVQIDKHIVDKAEDSTYFSPFKNFPSTISQTDRERLTQTSKTAIINKIVPAFRGFKNFLEKEYIPACYDNVGISQIPQGKEAYAFLARKHTTTNLTPEQIHEKGLQEVARIRAEMLKIIEKVGFKGTLQEFFVRLRTDPQFYYKTPEELLTAYRAMAKRIDPNLVKLFKTLPRTPYGVTPVPDNIAPDTTTAYYNGPAADGSRAGLYFVNLYKPEVRPKYEMMALSLHESVPGHHLQIALAQELGDIPNFRRYGGGYTSFVEGWALYAESLGDEMNLYDDPYSKFGQLTYEMWRAVRLVVDTGMHYFGWSRQKAIDFFRDNAAKTEQDIVNEIDRYIADPGQALAYKIGELKIKELRARAASQLGDKFDVREFHDVILLSGSVPLDILGRKVDAWIERKKKEAQAKS
jgi:uncharacterized protein (DUF885 family)